jgi:mannose-1-phosphate guanylyltransferase
VVLGSFAADYMISGDVIFLSTVVEAVWVTQKDYLVTIGIALSGELSCQDLDSS